MFYIYLSSPFCVFFFVELIKKEATYQEVEEQKKLMAEVQKQYEKLRILLEQKGYCKKRRENSATTFEMINNYNSSTRYRRRRETKNILEFIHGGLDGAVYGAWDFLVANTEKSVFNRLISSYKRGVYLQGIFGEALKNYSKSGGALKQAVSMKYQTFLSRRKYQFICRTQSSVFNSDSEVWVPRNAKCLGVDLRLPSLISPAAVDKFVKGLDIGHVNFIPSCSGVSRTVTGLVYMILDLHLRLAHLRKKLLWFDGNKFHFVFEFADDGAPETNELTMSVGSLTSWNFGKRVRCREYHYLLHCLSVGEKDDVMSAIWKQHSEEMKLLEGNILTVNGIQCTLEFQPSADQSWISWANNELNQAATYPSPYANVHKGNMSKIGGTIGVSANDTWNPPSKETRDKHLHKLEEYRKTLKNVDPKQKHKKELSFMAENGLREIGEPRISIFANRVRPEPVHCEINGWQHLLNLIYQEGLCRNLVLSVLKVLGNPVGQAEISRFGDNKLPIMNPNVSSQEGGVGERARQIESLNEKSDEFCQVIRMFTKRQMVSKESGAVDLLLWQTKSKNILKVKKINTIH